MRPLFNNLYKLAIVVSLLTLNSPQAFAKICTEVSIKPEVFKYTKKFDENRWQKYELLMWNVKLNIDFKQENTSRSSRIDIPKSPGITQVCTLVKGGIFKPDKPLSDISVSLSQERAEFNITEHRVGATPESEKRVYKDARIPCKPKIAGPLKTKTLKVNISRSSDGVLLCQVSAVVKK